MAVLVSRELPSFVRKILQEKENKGVELTVCPCSDSRAWNEGDFEDPGSNGEPGAPSALF
jgi:hypothetical protein